MAALMVDLIEEVRALRVIARSGAVDIRNAGSR
jgi:hypothetical protein